MSNLIYVLGPIFIIANIMFLYFMYVGFKSLKKSNNTDNKEDYDKAQKNFKYMLISAACSFVSMFICGTMIL